MSNSDGDIGLAWDISDDARERDMLVSATAVKKGNGFERLPLRPKRRLNTSLTTGGDNLMSFGKALMISF